MIRIGRQIPHFSQVEPASVRAVFSSDKRFRYLLEMNYMRSLLDDGRSRKAAVVLKNPSAADAGGADSTIRKVETFIYHHLEDVSRLSVLNIFALRATDATDLNREYRLNGREQVVGPDNDRTIRDITSEADYVVVAWGGRSGIDEGLYTDRVQEVGRILAGAGRSKLFEVGEQGNQTAAARNDVVLRSQPGARFSNIEGVIEMISVDNVSVRFGAFTLFDGISFQVNPGDRIGLVGRNGAGKTTLLNLISGKQMPDEGKVVVTTGKTVGYLPQQMKHARGKKLYAETLDAFEEILKLDEQIKKISRELEERSDHHSENYLDLIQELTNANERFEMEGGHTIHADVEQTLTGLGFRQTDMERPVHEFSGGWRMRIELAKILLRRPDFILLDEPTNHLDIESIQWLENFLATYPGGILIISHDRVFLDRVTNRTLDLSLGKVYDYRVPYSRYVELKQERITVQQAAYENQQKMIQDTEKFISRFRYKATKAVQVQSRIKQLDKLDRIEVEQEDDMVMNLRFPPAMRSGTIVTEATGLGKRFGDHTVLRDVDMVIERGEKVAFVGRNGEGKTTLSRILVGELDHTGHLKMGHNVELGYFAQNQDEIMDGNLTVLETIDRVAVGDIRSRMRDILGAFLFSGEEVDKKVKVLSGGERSRLAMAVMLMQPFNLLILDEPTNHLDMRSKDILKNALLAFDGTLIVVSHDREFLDGLVDKVFEFRDGSVKEYIGGIFEFLERRNLHSLRDVERKAPVKTSRKQPAKTGEADEAKEKNRGQDDNQAPAASASKQEYAEKKEQERKIRKITNRIKALEKEIEDLEEEISRMDVMLMNPENITGMQVYEDYEKLKVRLDEAMAGWEKQTTLLEKAEARRN